MSDSPDRSADIDGILNHFEDLPPDAAAIPPVPQPAGKPATRKPAAPRTAAAQKPAARKPAAKKPAARKPAARKPAAKAARAPTPRAVEPTVTDHDPGDDFEGLLDDDPEPLTPHGYDETPDLDDEPPGEPDAELDAPRAAQAEAAVPEQPALTSAFFTPAIPLSGQTSTDADLAAAERPAALKRTSAARLRRRAAAARQRPSRQGAWRPGPKTLAGTLLVLALSIFGATGNKPDASDPAVSAASVSPTRGPAPTAPLAPRPATTRTTPTATPTPRASVTRTTQTTAVPRTRRKAARPTRKQRRQRPSRAAHRPRPAATSPRHAADARPVAAAPPASVAAPVTRVPQRVAPSGPPPGASSSFSTEFTP